MSEIRLDEESVRDQVEYGADLAKAREANIKRLKNGFIVRVFDGDLS